MDIRISNVIQNQADLHKVDIDNIIKKSISHVSALTGKTVDMDIEIRMSLFPPMTTYYPYEKLARIFMFPGVFSLEPKEERENAIFYTMNHELYETLMDRPSFLHATMTSVMEKMLPAFDTSALRLESEDDDIDMRLKSGHCVTDVNVDRQLVSDINNARGFLTYHLFPHYSELSFLENFNGSIYDFLTVLLSQARRACIAAEIKPLVKGTKFQSYASIYTTSFDNILGKHVIQSAQEPVKNILKELSKTNPDEDKILFDVMKIKKSVFSA